MDLSFATPAVRMRYPVVDFEVDDPEILGAGAGLGELVEENGLEVEEEDEEVEYMPPTAFEEPYELPYDTMDMADLGQRVRGAAFLLDRSLDLQSPPELVLDKRDHLPPSTLVLRKLGLWLFPLGCSTFSLN